MSLTPIRAFHRRPPSTTTQDLARFCPSVSDAPVGLPSSGSRDGTVSAPTTVEPDRGPRPKTEQRRHAMTEVGGRSERNETQARRAARLTVASTLAMVFACAEIGQADWKGKFCSKTAR